MDIKATYQKCRDWGELWGYRSTWIELGIANVHREMDAHGWMNYSVSEDKFFEGVQSWSCDYGEFDDWRRSLASSYQKTFEFGD